MKLANISMKLDDATSADLWWQHGLTHQGLPAGCIGKLKAADDVGAAELMRQACSWLAEHGCGWAIGPMDGDTWHPYRVMTESTPVAPFPGEPTVDPRWSGWLENAGFDVIGNYTSSKASLLPLVADDRLAGAAARLRHGGVTIREMRMEDWDAELERMHRISSAAFTQAFLYTPLSFLDFKQLYEKARPLANARWIRIAERDGQAVAFLFSYEVPGRVLVLKTLAMLADRRLAGLGSVMTEELQRDAHEAGFSYALHVLQHESNAVQRISSRYGATVFRRYCLYGKRL